MPEVTENYIRIPNPNHKGCTSDAIRTIDLSTTKGIKALFCEEHREIKTYLFDNEKWDMERAQRWVDENAKDLNSFISKQWAKGFVKEIDEKDEGKLGLCVISSGTIDRDGDVLDPNGWLFNNFRKNPLLLWSHNASSGEKRPAIGRIEDVEVRNGQVYFTPVFDMKDPFAKEIYRKYKDNFLNAFSVGFLPLEWEETETGYHFKKQEALEFSAVNVPANPEALVVLREEGFKVSKSMKDWKKNKKAKKKKKKLKEPKDFKELRQMMAKHLRAVSDDKAWVKEYERLSGFYKQFDRVAPEVKHIETAIWKVARGKKVVKKEKVQKSNVRPINTNQADELIGLLRTLVGQSSDLSNKKRGGE